jgi:hypothetical protein
LNSGMEGNGYVNGLHHACSGGPEVLQNCSDRALFLCYPDDFEDSGESMALRCMRQYRGDCIVHVGELLGETCCMPSPWGRTSSADFQVQLATTFHKVLCVPLPSWPCSRDTLTVWKRCAKAHLQTPGNAACVVMSQINLKPVFVGGVVFAQDKNCDLGRANVRSCATV